MLPNGLARNGFLSQAGILFRTGFSIRLSSLTRSFAWGILLVLAGAGSTADAAIIAGTDPGDRMRFDSTGVENPDFVLGDFDVSGIGVAGVDADDIGFRGATLITPRHFITARHFPSRVANLRGSDGIVRQYTSSSAPAEFTTFAGANTGTSDILLFTLDEAIPESDGVTPLAVLDAQNTEDLLSVIGREIFLYDQNDQVGRNIVDDITISIFDPPAANPSFSVVFDFDDPANGGLADETRLVGGDSGRPALIDVDGTLAVVGTHFGVSNTNGEFLSFSTLITPYLDQIEAVTLAEGGFSLNRVAISAAVAVPEPGAAVMFGFLGMIWGMKRRRDRDG